MTNPSLAWRRLLDGGPGPVTAGEAPDRPFAVVFGCADAAFGASLPGRRPGGVMTVSTWGHVVDTGVLASVEYAVTALDVPLIMVLGHDDCPAMRLALQAWEHAEVPSGAARSAVEHAMLSIVRRGAAADSVAAVAAAHVVETGLALMQRSPAVARRVDAGTCGIVCANGSGRDAALRVHAAYGAVETSAEALAECV